MKSNPSIVSSGNTYQLFDSSIATHNELPVGTYKIHFSEQSGYSLHRITDLVNDEKVYGKHQTRVNRTLNTYKDLNRSLGVLLSGDKGIGKSLMVRLLSEKARTELKLPTIIVDTNTPGIAQFIDQIGEALIIFDEFEKVFVNGDRYGDSPSQQDQFLPLLDGMSLNKRMYVITVNSIYDLSSYFLNRPGRFHYHLRFDYPTTEEIAEYLKDQAPSITEEAIEEVASFSYRTPINYDHLRAIAFEIERGEKFTEIIGDLNIKRTQEQGLYYDITVVLSNGDVASGTSQLLANHGTDYSIFSLTTAQDEYWKFTLNIKRMMFSGEGISVPDDALSVEYHGAERGRRQHDTESKENVTVKSYSIVPKRKDELSFTF